jgi:hypothetical protein
LQLATRRQVLSLTCSFGVSEWQPPDSVDHFTSPRAAAVTGSPLPIPHLRRRAMTGRPDWCDPGPAAASRWKCPFLPRIPWGKLPRSEAAARGSAPKKAATDTYISVWARMARSGGNRCVWSAFVRCSRCARCSRRSL